MEERCSINIWINEERNEKLVNAGLAHLTKDALAKFDSATTKSIELLPAEVKEKLFNLIIEQKSLDIIKEFFKSIK